MFKIGEVQKVYINRITNAGVFVSDELNGSVEAKLVDKLDKKYGIDDEIEVFIYNQQEDETVATLKKPLVQVGQIGFLKVVGKVRAGYFLFDGIDKDVFMANDDAEKHVKIGDEVLVTIFLEERNYLNASMKIYEMLTTSSRFKVGETVTGIVYDIKSEMGAFVAVDDRFHGFIPKHELYKEVVVGARVTARITKIREDERLNLSIRQKTAVQIHDDETLVLEAIEKSGGFLAMGDHSSPEEIRSKLNLSKRAFKRVIGKLYKEGKIEITSVGIKKL